MLRRRLRLRLTLNHFCCLQGSDLFHDDSEEAVDHSEYTVLFRFSSFSRSVGCNFSDLRVLCYCDFNVRHDTYVSRECTAVHRTAFLCSFDSFQASKERARLLKRLSPMLSKVAILILASQVNFLIIIYFCFSSA